MVALGSNKNKRGNTMTVEELAKKIAIKFNMPKAEKYNIVERDFDGMLEIIGYMEDPSYDLSDLGKNHRWTPKSWLTIGVVSPYAEARNVY